MKLKTFRGIKWIEIKPVEEWYEDLGLDVGAIESLDMPATMKK